MNMCDARFGQGASVNRYLTTLATLGLDPGGKIIMDGHFGKVGEEADQRLLAILGGDEEMTDEMRQVSSNNNRTLTAIVGHEIILGLDGDVSSNFDPKIFDSDWTDEHLKFVRVLMGDAPPTDRASRPEHRD